MPAKMEISSYFKPIPFILAYAILGENNIFFMLCIKQGPSFSFFLHLMSS